MEFQVFHDYRRLARRGLVSPLACNFCELEYTLRVDSDDSPMLQCMSCGHRLKPGAKLYEQLEAAVKEHFGG